MKKYKITNTLTGNSYSANFSTDEEFDTWHNSKKYVHGDEDATPPTCEIIIEDIVEEPSYIALRRAEYPPLVDLADALYWQSKGDSSKMEAYLAACEAVKTKYPK